MNITINGTPRQLTNDGNLSDIVSALGKQPRHVITELNGSIIPSQMRGQTRLKDGDSLEIVTFVGGG
ncbi:MAG: sulfur carrier protein ThiS [Candidatus Omnitrophica bacterium]|nr:sulfur carrier protein ThiS [Candidatus Omnitrophota bacterium]MDE2010465.1 sulfur carrier protein ThiS [Candidatus Omnitrophota bacterium]MDE2215112.1 sulfur carrier protein ThiS [Candidatus Omnitrophota bacterium]MDE2232424.1 sulfur carrier protein ThiS [Candidatus Omnitrophota bacterium]